MVKPSRIVFETFCDMAIMLGFIIERHSDRVFNLKVHLLI